MATGSAGPLASTSMTLLHRAAALCAAALLPLAGCAGHTTPDPQRPPAADAPPTAQCTKIVHAYDLWDQQITWALRWVEGMRGSAEAQAVTTTALQDIKRYTDALSAAASNRTDQPSQQLAAAVTDFGTKLQTMATENAEAGSVDPQTYQQMSDAKLAVSRALDTFKRTCPPPQ